MLQRNFLLALATLVASAGTLVCCVLPAVMVALGAGAVLAGLLSEIPALIWLSAQKALVFGIAALLLAISGAALLHAKRLPCPADSRLADACGRMRRASVMLWWVAAGVALIGTTYAFLLPALA